jgi:hypothetical protein
MTRRWWTIAVAGLAGVWLSGATMLVRVTAQAPQVTAASGKKAGEAFKNVTTSTLKELSVDDFIAAMGVMAAGLGLDCADCHPGAGTDKVDWVIDTPQKRMARRMVEMVATLNRANFGSAQKVTCWTCHHGRLTPATTIALDTLYDTPNSEDDDVVAPDRSQPTADQILDKYVQAVGGAQKVGALTSFIATGKSIGYGELGGSAAFAIYAKAPNEKTTLITFPDHPERGRSLWTFDGTTGWINTPRALLVEYELVGTELDGARLEAQLAFPAQIKSALTNWRSGTRRTIGNKDYQVIQGTGPRNYMATLYFDPETGLLRRLVRYGPSPVGRVPVQTDYADWRDVNGIKFPFEYKFSWLDGRYTAKIDQVQANVPIDASKFGRNAK